MSSSTQRPARPSGAVIPPGRLVSGLQLPIQATSTQFAEPWERSARARDLEAVVRKADSSGFFYVAVCDRIAVPEGSVDTMGTSWYEPTTTLAWIAAMTQRVRVLSEALVLPYRHPLLVAKTFMTLDTLSAGRSILGVGPGDLEPEFELLGVDFAERDARLDDALDVIEAAFADEFPDVTTPTWSSRGFGLAPRPVQVPLPIWIAGSSSRAMRRAAERGDGWLPQQTHRDNLAAEVAQLRRLREKAGGDAPIDIGAVVEPLYIGDPEWDVGAGTIFGSADHVARSLLELGEMGANHLRIRLRSRSLDELLDQMDAFGSTVIPILDPNGQRSERYDEPSFRDIAVISRQHVQAMETSDAEEVWGAIGNELLLLRTLGRRTGREHKVALAFWRDRSGAPILVGSYAGAPMHPDWFLNLADRSANPTVVVRTRDRTYMAVPQLLEGAEYHDVWRQLTLDRPSYRNYAARTKRRFALIRLIEQS